MKLTLRHAGVAYDAELEQPIVLARAVVPHGPTSAFGLGQAACGPVDVGGGVVLDTRRGGSVNCFDVTFNPHGHGTHTESVAHITDNGPLVDQLILPPYCVALVVTVEEKTLRLSGESGPLTAVDTDRVIDSAALGGLGDTSVDALIVRLRGRSVKVHDLLNLSCEVPGTYHKGANDIHKDANELRHPSDTTGTNPPYFTNEAMTLLAASSLTHLVVELPSIDRENDGGTTPNHRVWWGLQPNDRDATNATHPNRTITELAHIVPGATDGLYALSLQVAPFAADAAPSRPILYVLTLR